MTMPSSCTMMFSTVPTSVIGRLSSGSMTVDNAAPADASRVAFCPFGLPVPHRKPRFSSPGIVRPGNHLTRCALSGERGGQSTAPPPHRHLSHAEFDK